MASGMTKTQLVRHMAEKLETNNKTASAGQFTIGAEALTIGVPVAPTLRKGLDRLYQVTVGANPTQTITFGTGVGQVFTLAGLNTALKALTGVNAANTGVNLTNGNISIEAANATDNLTVAGTPASGSGTISSIAWHCLHTRSGGRLRVRSSAAFVLSADHVESQPRALITRARPSP